jgi:hypothetical protein
MVPYIRQPIIVRERKMSRKNTITGKILKESIPVKTAPTGWTRRFRKDPGCRSVF